MVGKTRLKRTRQCAKCPWKVGTDPHSIPDGYSVELHRQLEHTIAKDPASMTGEQIHELMAAQRTAMSCHEHSADEKVMCIGWLVNQLGPGNNIALRMDMIQCENASEIHIDGEQHETFEDTLPSTVE